MYGNACRGRRANNIRVEAPDGEANGVHPDHIKKGYVPRIPGERLAASYINHYIANGGIVCPQFGGEQSKSDELALEVLSNAYPGRKVVGVHSRDVLLNAGNVH
ncbi:putative agmatine deiminase, partial [Tetrabaena socialis]